jgi:PAS domain S-box-containing protein
MFILVVEDDPGIAFLISEALNEKGRKVELVYSGREALHFIETRSPELIIMDYSLPDMNAAEIISNLRKKNISIPPFIVSTGQGDENIAVEMMKMGAHDYLIKDTSLLSRISGVVQRAQDDINRDKRLKEALLARQMSDRKLIEEQRRLANILKATNVGTWEWNIKTDEIIVNDRYAQIIGRNLSDLSGKTFSDLKHFVHPEDDAHLTEQLNAHFNKKDDYFEAEIRLGHKSGGWIWVLNRGCIMEFSADGKPQIMSGTIQDITHKKQRDDLVKEVEVAHKTLQFRQNFLASMSHEMRTPLTGILGITEMLSKTTLDDEQADYLETLKTASDSLKEIIDQVLDYSKIEAGNLKIRYNPFKLENLVSQAKKIFESICRKPLQFNGYLDSSLPKMVKADEKRIVQVINNLVVNAIKYSENGSVKLIIMPGKIRPNNEVEIQVEIVDTGIGIKPEKIDFVFTPFSQIHQIETSYYEGAGLGLAISKEIVELHGGNIGLESTPGEGTSVWFTFVAQRVENQNEISSAEEKLPDIPPLKILLVEDKEITQKVLNLQLKDMGHDVKIVSNGKEAIKGFVPDTFDLVLMDIQMPVMDGITATNILRGMHKELPPIVGLSANAFEGDREKYMSLGFDEYLIKPMKREHFYDLVQRLFPAENT